MIFPKRSLLFWLGVALASASAERLATAQSRVFNIGGTNATLEDVSGEIRVLFRALRFNEVTEQWNVDVVLTNTGGRQFAPAVVVSIEAIFNATGPLQTNGVAGTPPKPFLLFGQGYYGNQPFLPGGATPPRAISMGYVEGAGAPRLDTKVFALPLATGFALGITRSLNGAGQPLTGVNVIELGPAGQRALTTDPAYGVVTLGQGPGAYVWRFDSTNYLPVWRKETLTVSNVLVVANPRLVRRSTNSVFISSSGGQIQDPLGGVQIVVPAGALTQPTNVTLTVLDGQTLPGLLPLGWSPLRVFWFECDRTLSQPATALLRPPASVDAADSTALVRWNETRAEWEVTQILTGNGTNALSMPISRGGAFAWVVGDRGTLAPPAPQSGQDLRGSTASQPAANSLTASGVVNPTTSAASRVAVEVTGTASLMISSTNAPLPSGLQLRCDVGEDYQLLDGSKRFTPQYENFVVGYQRPGDADEKTLQAIFPMRPLLLLGSEELAEAKVRADVLVPTAFTGGVFETAGNAIEIDGIRIVSDADDFSSRQAALVRRLTPTNFQSLVSGSGFSIAAAFDLTVAAVASGHSLSLQVTNLPTNRLFVLASILSDARLAGLEPIERLQNDTNAVLRTVEPAAIEHLSGLTQAGQYLLLEAPAPQGLVSGITRNAGGQPVGGLPVRVTGQPWVTLSKADGSYQLLAPTGAVQVSVTDLTSGNADFVDFVLSNPTQPTPANLTTVARGPRVVSINPANGATKVPRGTPIIVTFSEPVNPGTLLGGGIQLLGSNGLPVVAPLTLNLGNITATLLPTEQLSPSALHTIVLSTNIADPTGFKLEGTNLFTFTTESDSFNRASAQLIIYEPTNSLAPVFGTPGSADPESPVILVNETSGQTATILSRTDGSFTNFIPADVDDFISAVLVNRNGTRITLPASRQIFRDGSVGLYQAGGILEAESDGGPVQVIVEPGAIPNKTKFKIEPISLTEILTLLSNTPPTNASLIARGINIRAEGDNLEGPIDISIPVTQAELAQAGVTNGAEPERSVFGLVAPFTLAGDPVYVLVDKMTYENGRLTTHSPPFPGADKLLNPPTRVREVFENMLLLNSFRHLAGGAEGSANSLAVVPLLMATRSQPALFTGKVFEVVAGPNNQVSALRTLAGALVTVNALGHFSQGRPGRLAPGSICCTSGETGGYALMVPVPELGSPLQGSPEEFVLSAQHPRRADQVTQLASVREVTAHLTDIIFPGLPRGPTTDPNPPNVSVFHAPTFPAAGANAQVVVLATHGSGQPIVTFDLDDPSIPQSLVQLTPGLREVLGPTAVRASFNVVSSTNAVVRFKASGSVGGARADVPYAIAFTGTGPTVINPVAADAHDSVGPHVVRSLPRDDLGQSAPALGVGQPIQIEFNEAISRAVVQPPNAAVVLRPAAGELVLDLSPDQRLLTIRSYSFKPDTAYTLTLSSQITDIASPPNRLDQNPFTLNKDPYVLHFHTAPIPSGPLTGISSGGGVVMRGIYAYALERYGSLDGAVVAYDLSDPQHPRVAGQISVPGFPRDVALVPSYSFATDLSGASQTSDLLAVVGGKLGGAADQFGNLLEGFQYMWIIDIHNPTSPTRLAAANLTLSPSAAVTKVQWSPPFLAYLESDADSQAVGLVNLQSYILGSHLARNQFSATVNFGKDLNGDGDFVDPGEELPVPSVSQTRVAGEAGRFGLEETTQRIQDFDFVSGEVFLGVVLSGGEELDQTGHPIGSISPGYLTLLRRGIKPDRHTAFLPITGGLPKRVSTLFGVRFVDQSGHPRLADLALISVNPDTGPPGRLDVVEISDVENPKLLSSVTIPQPHGLVQSAKLRDDGFLMLATSEDMLLLDPSKLTTPQPQGNTPHPALMGLIPGLGTGARAFDGEGAGIHVVNLGGRNIVKQTAPQIFFVFFPEPPFSGQQFAVHPQSFRHDPAKVASALNHMQQLEVLPPARFRPIPKQGIPSSLTPPDRQVHYYVLVQAPGSAGDTIDVALETLNESGYPKRNKGAGFAPVRAMSEEALKATRQQPRRVDAPIHALTAFRLSQTDTEPTYNFYLSKPFALTCEPMTAQEVNDLTKNSGLDREILWSGNYLRAYLDYSMSPAVGNNPVLGAFAGVLDSVQSVILPGTVAVAETFPADYTQGPNPVAAIGHATLPCTFGCLVVHNGEIRTETLDMKLPSRRMPIIFKRTIAGQDLYDGPFGRGWDFNYNQRITLLNSDLIKDNCPCSNPNGQAGPKDLLFYNGEGRVLLYTAAGTNAPPEFFQDPLLPQLNWISKVSTYYHSPTGNFDMIVQFTDNRFGRLLPDGTQFWYSPVGRLETIYNRYTTNFQVMSYDDRGELVRIQDRSVITDRYLDIGYYRDPTEQGSLSPLDKTTQIQSEIGKIYRLVDYTGGSLGVGRDVLFHYSDRGELVLRESIEITTNQPGGFLGRQKTEYQYGLSPPTSPPQFPLANDLTGIVDAGSQGAPLMNVVSYQAGTTTPSVQRLGGAQGEVRLDFLYNNTAEALAAGLGKVKATNPDTSTSQMTLSPVGLPEATTFDGPGNPPVPAVTYQTFYNNFGLPEELHYPKGDRIVYTYESVSPNLRNKPNIRVIQRFPSRAGDPIFTCTMDYDRTYNLQKDIQEDFDRHKIRYELTSDGLDIARIIYPPVTPQLPSGFTPPIQVGMGATEEFEYNEYGQIIRHVDRDGIVRKWKFDRPDGFARAEIQGEGTVQLTTTLTYNGLAGLIGLPHEHIPPLHARTTFTYNEREELLTAQRSSLVSRFAYDENGRLIERTATVDNTGKKLVEKRTYEHNGFLKESEFTAVETGFNQQDTSLKTTFIPDSMFRVIKTILPNGETNSFEDFDQLGRPHTRRVGTYVESYEYDDNNNLRFIRRGTAITEFQYDGHNRLETELHPIAGRGTEKITHKYFDGGAIRETTVQNSNGQVIGHVQYQIDGLGRPIVTLTDSDAGQVVGLQRLDQSLRERHISSPEAEVTAMSYDVAGRPILVRNSVRLSTFTNDQNNNLTMTVAFEGLNGRNVFTNDHRPFDELDRSQELRDNLGLISTSSYRADGRILESTDARGNTNSYSYTRLGEPTVIRQPGGIEFHYAYDRNRYKILEGDVQDKGWKFTYDSSLRLEAHTRRDGNTFTNSNFDARNQPQTITFPGLNVGLSYDEQSRLLSYNSTYLGYVRGENFTYDAGNRIEAAFFNGGSFSNRYDLLGPLRETTLKVGPFTFVTHSDLRADSLRTNVIYPSMATGLSESRDISGRLLTVTATLGDPIVAATTYETADLIGNQLFGPGLIVCSNVFDGRKRMLQRTYTRVSDGKLLSQLRYAFDANNNVIAKQSLDRGGRVDFFQYDVNNRLVRGDFGARPVISNASSRQLTGFSVPLDVNPKSWSPGLFGRNYSYDPQKLDLLTGSTTDNPDALAVPPFAASITNFDGALHAGSVDGFTRGRDSLGNTTNAILQVRLPGSSGPTPVPATLQYDGKGQLVQIKRVDSVVVDYDYLPNGLCLTRKVSGPASRCVPSERIFVWDDARLIEEYDVTSTNKNLRARYFYTDSDVPVAADLADSSGTLHRHYFLVDLQGSLSAIADRAGNILERYTYDAWGQANIEPADNQAPAVRRILTDTNGLLIEFSERVLPALVHPVPGSTTSNLVALFADFSTGLIIEQAGNPVAGTFTYEESLPGFGFGTVLRFQPSVPLTGNCALRIQAAALNDEWNNPIIGVSIPFTFVATQGTQLFTNLVSTSTPAVGRTVSDQPFLFHGQYFDFEAGLIYLRARFYDPSLGMFLQPDPAGYADSVNLYAGFANNPQTLRDPSGRLIFVPVMAAIGAVIGAVIAGGLEYLEQGEFNRKVFAAAAGGAAAGATAGFTSLGLIAAGALYGAVNSVVEGGINRFNEGHDVLSSEAIKADALTGATSGAIAGAVFSVAAPVLGAVLKEGFSSLKGVAGSLIEGRLAPGAGRTAAEITDSIVLGPVRAGPKKVIALEEGAASRAAVELEENTRFDLEVIRNIVNDATVELPTASIRANGVHLFNEAIAKGEAIDVAAAAFKSPMYRQAVPGFFDVGVHGQAGRAIFKIGEDVWVNLRREEVAEVMLAGGYVPGTPIRLISCESGSTARGFAAFLSKQFDAYLIAPSHRVELRPSPLDMNIKNGGSWVEFLRGVRLGPIETSVLKR